MIRSAVTLNLIESMSQGPWIFWHNLEESLKKAADLGFDGVELFTRSGTDLDANHLQDRLDQHGLQLAAVGTGAGKVLHGLTLTDANPEIRQKAMAFIAEMITFGARFGAPAIIGSMQGNVLPSGNREDTFALLAEGLKTLGNHAASKGVPLIYEPLNRYETNLFNTLESGSGFLEKNGLSQVKLLADLFHMNIEEDNLSESIRKFGKDIGHVHFADSNRKPMGFGHTEMAPIAEALKEIGYAGYVSAEAFPFPNPDAAAEQTIKAFREYFRN
ncbi:sugar phosphate isomerase/epimerase family protein [Algoriphagus sp. AK58]|uniref:sugar phosphate isomerase/epimerase family protein n=1 Tax=Algoriphagus sp. AK58 TaxID=1406877 RepID=UPI00164F8E60|nr:sugar phosphate isomerase/epimerase family protein [Algoriphagus sp. AK58]MBC6368725.1 sugar phosphate isomerase [Algoriphagus sp. AK58]